MAWGDSDPQAPAGYLSRDEFGRLMDTTFGAGKWRETGGWRSQAREEQLRQQGAQTVKPGGVSAHSLGDASAPGAHDVVVQGMSPAQVAARLKQAGYGLAEAIPEGDAGGQGAHLHVGMSASASWGADDKVTGWGGGDPVLRPSGAPAYGPLEEAGRIARSAAGGVIGGAGKVVQGAAELADAYVGAITKGAAKTGQLVEPESGVAIPLSPEERVEAAKPVTASARAVAPTVEAFGRADKVVSPANRNMAESIAHGAGEMVPALGAALANPVLGAGVFAAQGTAGAEDEARAAGANPETVERSGVEGGAVQGVLGALPVGEIAAPVVKGMKGVVTPFLAGMGVRAAADAGLGAGMQVGSNVVAEQNFDPARPWYANVPESAASMAAGGAALHLGGAAIHGAASALTTRLRPAETPVTAAEPAPPQDGAPAGEAVPAPTPAAETPAPVLPETNAAQLYAQSTAHLAGAQTPDGEAVQPAEPPAAYEAARVSEGAPLAEMAPAIADVAEYRSAAPKGYSLFQAMKDLGGIRSKTADGDPVADVGDLLDGVRRPGLVNNKTGLTPDQMREALQQRGWFAAYDGRQTAENPGASRGDEINDLFDLMGREAHGQKVFHPADTAPEVAARRAQLDQDFNQAGITSADSAEVAAAKLAAYRHNAQREQGIAMQLLRDRADAAGVTHSPEPSYDELLGDVLEREAIQGEDDGAGADADERHIDGLLLPEEHDRLFAADPGAEGERGPAEGVAGLREGPEAVPAPPQGDQEPGAGAGGRGDQAAEAPGAAELAAEPVRLADGEAQQTLIPGTERSAQQAAAAREGPLKPNSAQEEPGGLFAAREPEQSGMFDPAPAKPEARAEARKPEAKSITDAGEKIGGARKDQWAQRGLDLNDLEHLSTGEAHQYVVKDQVWPKPDYEADVAGGTESEAAALKKLIRDRLAAKPRTDSAQGRHDYVAMMGTLRSELEAAKTVAQVRSVRDRVLYDRLGWPRDWHSRPEKAVSDRLFSIMKGRTEQLRVDGTDLRKARQMVEEGFPGKAAPWSRRYDVKPMSDGRWAIYPKGKYVPEERGLATRDEAVDRAKALYEALATAGADEERATPARPHLDSIQREGPDVRQGKDVGSDDFVKDFGFRGVEFGNWVASDERRKAVNLAYDALHDMAHVLGIPPEAVSLDGKLGLAFGSRGTGRAAAHYEPGKLVINLTKLSGAGSLGHEWGHALDHYFGSLDRDQGSQGAARGASGWYDRMRDVRGQLANLRPEMADAFQQVMDALFRRELPRAEAVRDQELRVETIQAAIDRQQKRIDQHIERNKDGEPDRKFLKDSREFIEAQRGALKIAGERLAKLRDETAPYTGPKVRSSFDAEAQKLSGKAGEKGYWARPTELFARAFESYLFDRIKGEGRKSEYLVQGVEPERYASERYKGNPYPTGAEREAINAAFDHLFATMSVRDGDRGPALFRRGPGEAEPATPLARGLEGVPLDPAAQKAHAELIDEVGRIVAKVAPTATSKPMGALRETATGGRIEAATWRDGAKHVIAWSLDTPDVVGAARHEALHVLRAQGMFTPREWGALAGEALDSGWMQRYRIADRYPDLSHEGQIEEAVAERFADWRRDRSPALPAFARELFRRLEDVLRQIAGAARKLLGKDPTAADVFEAMQRGEVGGRGAATKPAAQEGLAPAFQRPRPKEDGSEPEAMSVHAYIATRLGEGAEALGHRIKRAADRAFPDPVKEALDSLRMGVSPLSMGSDRAKAAAKDFANTQRAVRWEWGRVDAKLEKAFSPERRKAMWEAADEESVIRQTGAEPGEGNGLNRLPAGERAVVEELQRRANDAFQRAKALGMTKADPLPSYVPRMVVDMSGGEARRVSRDGPATSAKTGRNLSSTTGQLRHREHLTAEETERAAQASFGEGATVVRDIRTLAYATQKLEDAIAGRTLVQKIREVGNQIGETLVHEGSTDDPGGYFTIDHPALKTWAPKFAIDNETGKSGPVMGPDGKPIMEAKPLYIAKEFEGPLKAVLTTPTGPLYNGIMALKGKAMSVIMFSPLMHNAVIWGKAIPAAPRQVLSFDVYRRGFQAKNDPATMLEAIHAGLDPIGRHFGATQDITGIAAPPQIAPGQSWTAQLIGGVPGFFSKDAGEATKRAIDKLGDVWHNTFLWDRVGDLQMGLYKSIRDSEIKKGLDPLSAQHLAAHFANRYAGALPMEGMSKVARQIANVALFSRSFTLGNLGAYKDIVRGLPGEVQAQILRDTGAEALTRVQGEARLKALGMLGLDVMLSFAGVWLAEAAISAVAHQAFQAPPDNEPGKQDRFLIRYQPDGTAVYGRMPTGKVGEDLVKWATEPMETLKAKLSPFSRLAYEAATNDKGFGQKLYDPYDRTPLGLVKNIGRLVWATADSIAPTGVLQGMHDLITGTGKHDRATAAMQVALPVAGITVSTGAPGGPAMADLYQEQDRHTFQVQERLPAIMDQIRAGDVEGARSQMALMGVPPGLASYYIRIAKNPGARLTGRKVQDFRRAATPEERARFDRDRQAASQRDADE